jgi:hypothetical protein
MNSKLIYLYYLPLTESLQRLFFMDYLRENGVPLEYWDLSALYFDAPNRAGEISRPYVRAFGSRAEISEALTPELIAGTLFVPVLFYGLKVLDLYRLLTKRGARLCHFIIGFQPVPEGGLARKIFRNLGYLAHPRKMSNFLGNRIAAMIRRLGLVKGYAVVFAAGEAAAALYEGTTKIVRINHCDYDEVLLHRGGQERIVGEKYCVFLDDCMPHHPDLELLGVKPVAAQPYYRTLGSFFSALERRHGARVIVAAHPQSNYRENPFSGRRVFQGKTRQLVEHCEFALTTVSSSVSYAVLNEKPLLFFSTDAIARDHGAIKHDDLSRHFAGVLDRPWANIDHMEATDLDVGPVDQHLYAAYKYNYLTTKASAGRPSRDICLDFLRQNA